MPLPCGKLFTTLWGSGTVATPDGARKTVDHPQVGAITLDCDVLTIAGANLCINIYSAEPGTEDAERLALLAVCRAAGPARGIRHTVACRLSQRSEPSTRMWTAEILSRQAALARPAAKGLSRACVLPREHLANEVTAGALAKSLTTRRPPVSASPDLIVTNARVYTCDPAAAWAEAVAVSDGSITAVGTATEIAALATAGTEVVDAGGRMVMPGLVDIHTHLVWGGTQMVWELKVQPDDTLDEVLAKVGARARTMPDGEWMVGGILGSPLMDRVAAGGYLDALDAAAEGQPVLLRDDSYHNRWANSKALELMGIDQTTPDPPDGTVGRDRGRQLTGVLQESAAALAERVAVASIGDPVQRNLVALRAAVEYVNSFGVTAVQDAATLEPWLRAMRDLDDEGALTLWVVASLPARPFLSEGITGEELCAAAPGYRRHQIRPNFVKFFLDGVPMTRTSALLEPYICHGAHEDPADTGHLLWTDEELVAALDRCLAAGYGAKFHATGDRSVRQALDAIEIMRERYGNSPLFHSAHVLFVAPSDLPRFTDLGVVADASPSIWFPTPFDESIVNQVPQSVVDRSWPFRQLVDHGALLAAGSDWPIVPTPNPWIAMEAMITRANPDPRITGQVNPSGAIPLVEAISAYTSNSARALGMADIVGAITPGRSADFIVLNHNLFDVETDAIHTTEVLQTYFRGRRVHGSEL